MDLIPVAVPPRFLVTALVLLTSCSPQARRDGSADAQVIVPRDDLAEITIITPNLWSVRVRPDGSGQVGFGSSFQDFAVFPQGTFAFTGLYEQLYPQCRPEGSLATDFSVSFVKVGESATRAHYCADARLIGSIFERAVTFADKEGTRVDEEFRRRPPVP